MTVGPAMAVAAPSGATPAPATDDEDDDDEDDGEDDDDACTGGGKESEGWGRIFKKRD